MADALSVNITTKPRCQLGPYLQDRLSGTLTQ